MEIGHTTVALSRNIAVGKKGIDLEGMNDGKDQIIIHHETDS